MYAVGGVSSSDYVLPSVSDALTSSAIALQERKVLTDLMTASVTLVDGDDRRRFHSAAEKESHEYFNTTLTTDRADLHGN